MVQRRVVTVSPFVQPKLLGEKRTLVPRRRNTAYRLRRNRGRIKLFSRRKKKRSSEQKINEKVGHVLVRYYDQNGDKTIPSTSVSNFRSLGVSILPFPHPTSLKLLSLIDERYAAADQSARRVGFHDLSVTIIASGAKERSGSRIQRSPMHKRRDSPNDKSLNPRHERVVFIGFVLLTCMMFTRLTINPTALISLGNETHFIEVFPFTHLPFRFSFSLPARNKQIRRDGQCQCVQNDAQTSRWFTIASWLIRSRSRLNHHHCPEGCISGSIPPSLLVFSSKFPSNCGPFLLSQLTI